MNNKLMIFVMLSLLVLVVMGGSMAAQPKVSRYISYMTGGEDETTASAAPMSSSRNGNGNGNGIRGWDLDYAPYQLADVEWGNMPPSLNVGCQMKSGVGLASSLLPREPAAQEKFGEFAPDSILEGQQFLDPRSQIGIPETMGGALRNANQSIRADPPNPKQAYTWNNSTIVPDLMQRQLVV